MLSLLLAGALLAQEKIEFAPQEGTTTEKTQVKIHQILNIAGMDLETSGETSSAQREVIAKRAADGTLRVKTIFDGMKVALTLPGGKSLAYDSSKPGQKADDPQLQPLVDTWEAMKGLTYIYVLGKDNQPTAIEGLDEVLAKVPAAVAVDLKKELEPQRLIRDYKQGHAFLPDGPVKKGDRWERTEIENIGAGQTLTYKTYYEYQGTVEKNGKTVDKIGVFHNTVTYAIDPSGPLPLKVVNSDMKIESSMGTVYYDRQLGTAIESGSITRITGPMTFEANGMQLPGKLDLTLDTFTTRTR